MRAFEHVEFFRVRGLDSKTDAVDSNFSQFTQIFVRDRSWIRFDADLAVEGQGKRGANAFENRVKLKWREKRGRPTAKEYGVHFGLDTPLRGYSTNELYFLAQCLHISWDHCLLSGIGIEVAIGAAMCAKGDMEVKTKRSHQMSILPDAVRCAIEKKMGWLYDNHSHTAKEQL